MKFRAKETAALEAVNANMVAKPKPKALTTELEHANKGHSPNSCTVAVLLRHKPSMAIF